MWNPELVTDFKLGPVDLRPCVDFEGADLGPVGVDLRLDVDWSPGCGPSTNSLKSFVPPSG